MLVPLLRTSLGRTAFIRRSPAIQIAAALSSRVITTPSNGLSSSALLMNLKGNRAFSSGRVWREPAAAAASKAKAKPATKGTKAASKGTKKTTTKAKATTKGRTTKTKAKAKTATKVKAKPSAAAQAKKAAKLEKEKKTKAAKVAKQKALKAAKLEKEKALKAARLEKEKALKAAKAEKLKALKAAQREKQKAVKAKAAEKRKAARLEAKKREQKKEAAKKEKRRLAVRREKEREKEREKRREAHVPKKELVPPVKRPLSVFPRFVMLGWEKYRAETASPADFKTYLRDVASPEWRLLSDEQKAAFNNPNHAAELEAYDKSKREWYAALDKKHKKALRIARKRKTYNRPVPASAQYVREQSKIVTYPPEIANASGIVKGQYLIKIYKESVSEEEKEGLKRRALETYEAKKREQALAEIAAAQAGQAASAGAEATV